MLKLHTKELVKARPEDAVEPLVVITSKARRQTVTLVDLSKYELSNFGSLVGCFARHQVYNSGEQVGNSDNAVELGVVIVRWGQGLDEVNSHCFPRSGRDSQGVLQPVQLLIVGLAALAGIAVSMLAAVLATMVFHHR
jgi:hypothetical protein